MFQRVIAHSVPSEYFSVEAAASIGREVTAARTPVQVWDVQDRLIEERPSLRRAAWSEVSFGVQRG
jgi:hypothetical protein